MADALSIQQPPVGVTGRAVRAEVLAAAYTRDPDLGYSAVNS